MFNTRQSTTQYGNGKERVRMFIPGCSNSGWSARSLWSLLLFQLERYYVYFICALDWWSFLSYHGLRHAWRIRSIVIYSHVTFNRFYCVALSHGDMYLILTVMLNRSVFDLSRTQPLETHFRFRYLTKKAHQILTIAVIYYDVLL